VIPEGRGQPFESGSEGFRNGSCAGSWGWWLGSCPDRNSDLGLSRRLFMNAGQQFARWRRGSNVD